MGEMDEVVKEFLVESHENLDQLDRDLLKLEQSRTDADAIKSVFRTIHTIKGTSGFLGFSKLESLTHVAESLLCRLRDQTLTMTQEIATALLNTTDAVRRMLASIEANGGDGDETDDALRATLVRLNEPTADATTAEPRIAAASPAGGTTSAPGTPDAITPNTPLGEILIATKKVTPADIELARELQQYGDTRRVGDILVENEVLRPSELREALEHQAAIRQKETPVSETNVRVDVSLLDRLMNLVGELVLARNQILQFNHTLGRQDSQFTSTSQRLNLITTELQEGVMKTRMQPIGTVWNKFPRIVRDLAKSVGKNVVLRMEGKETDLDRTIIEAIKDPLTHIVRNSIDHGIESEEERVRRGKSPQGTLGMRAFHEGGQVIIEIADDGGGIDPERIKAKAVSKQLITADQAARMGERELLNLIFLPGFSTAEQVTNISGRGVGMDVVRSNIEKIGGTVDIASRVGEGTVLKIKIPLTLAIIPALIVRSAGERYAIPQVNLLELVRLEGEEARLGIESIHGSEVHRLRGNLLPIVRLNEQLELEPPGSPHPDVVNIVVLSADDRQFGLVVDQVMDTEEIVVKPLTKALKGIGVYAGATIMGDGHVALILDTFRIAQRANVVSESRERSRPRAETRAASGDTRETLLLFMAGSHRMALPLDQVHRLEEFPHANVERAGDEIVVQYRGEIMPLIPLAQRFGAGAQRLATNAGDHVQVVVHRHGERFVGLLVDRIVDIVDEDVTAKSANARRGVRATAVVHGKVTEILDVATVAKDALPLGEAAPLAGGAS
jgi:two-component system chemotaxis sensor kinase CheA